MTSNKMGPKYSSAKMFASIIKSIELRFKERPIIVSKSTIWFLNTLALLLITTSCLVDASSIINNNNNSKLSSGNAQIVANKHKITLPISNQLHNGDQLSMATTEKPNVAHQGEQQHQSNQQVNEQLVINSIEEDNDFDHNEGQPQQVYHSESSSDDIMRQLMASNKSGNNNNKHRYEQQLPSAPISTATNNSSIEETATESLATTTSTTTTTKASLEPRNQYNLDDEQQTTPMSASLSANEQHHLQDASQLASSHGSTAPATGGNYATHGQAANQWPPVGQTRATNQQFGSSQSVTNQVQHPSSINAIISEASNGGIQQQQQQQQPSQLANQLMAASSLQPATGGQLILVPASGNLNGQQLLGVTGATGANGRRISLSGWLRNLSSMLANIFNRREHGPIQLATGQPLLGSTGGQTMVAAASSPASSNSLVSSPLIGPQPTTSSGTPAGGWLQLGPNAPHWLAQAQSAIQQLQQQAASGGSRLANLIQATPLGGSQATASYSSSSSINNNNNNFQQPTTSAAIAIALPPSGAGNNQLVGQSGAFNGYQQPLGGNGDLQASASSPSANYALATHYPGAQSYQIVGQLQQQPAQVILAPIAWAPAQQQQQAAASPMLVGQVGEQSQPTTTAATTLGATKQPTGSSHGQQQQQAGAATTPPSRAPSGAANNLQTSSRAGRSSASPAARHQALQSSNEHPQNHLNQQQVIVSGGAMGANNLPLAHYSNQYHISSASLD